jgi:hypothetical protein
MCGIIVSQRAFARKSCASSLNQISLVRPTSSDPPLPQVGSDLKKWRVGREIRVQNSRGVRNGFAVRPEEVGSDQIRPVKVAPKGSFRTENGSGLSILGREKG